MLTSKKIWKPSTFRDLPISEYNKILVFSLWLDFMVSQPIEFKKRFRGLQTRIIDIFHIIYFPLRFAMTLLFGIPIVYFEKKSNKRMEEKYKNKAGDVTLQVDFFYY
jgi:hypothetical protein